MHINAKQLKRFTVDDLKIEIMVCVAMDTTNISITFRNSGSQMIALLFDNSYRDVEISHLVIKDDAEQRIKPIHRVYIRPAINGFELHEIEPHCDWTYELKGKLEGNILSFPGCEYLLNRRQTYYIQYEYPYDRLHNYRSNEFAWTVPTLLTEA